MLDSYFTYKGMDDAVIAARKWVPDKTHDHDSVRAVVQIVHGMAEHIGRYDTFARMLSQAQMVVCGNDHRGHGQTATGKRMLGRVKHDWDYFLQDVKMLTAKLRQEYPEQPIFLFGHNFGSLIVRALMQTESDQIDGVILSGNFAPREVQRKLSKLLVRLQLPFLGRSAKARLLTCLTIRTYNRHIRPRHTAYDWLSRDKQSVKNYIQDPYCGHTCSLCFYRNLFEGMDQVSHVHHYHQTRKTIPILLLGGDQDPVGKGKEGMEATKTWLEQIGMHHVTTLLYEHGRHEMLHERNRADVFQDIVEWLHSNMNYSKREK